MSLFIRINNRKNFLLKEIPSLHPDSMAYIEYWGEQTKRCIEGFWGIDDNNIPCNIGEVGWDKDINSSSWRFIPPVLYFYINFGTILHKPEDAPKSEPQQKMKPLLRDFDWEFHYNWIEARGFSGFEEDEEYTCLEDVLEWKLGRLTKKNIHKSAFNKDHKLKEYVPTREYIRRLFNKPMGTPIYQNEPKSFFVLSSRGGGKCLKNSELVYYKDRVGTIGEVKAGDEIYGSDGKLTVVTNVYPQPKKVLYKLQLRDGREIICCEEHIWKVFDKSNRKFLNLKLKDFKDSYYNIRIDSKHREKYKEAKYVKEFKYAIPNSIGVDFSEKILPIDPYTLGLLLGDGCITNNYYSIKFTTGDSQLVNWLKNKYPDKISIYNKGKNYELTFRGSFLNKELTCLNLLGTYSNTKFIPNIYLYSSREQRLELLRGLMDTDGFADSRHTEYYTTSSKLADNVVFLLQSLGIQCKKSIKESSYKDKNNNKVKCKDCYRISLYTDKKIFNLDRKQSKVQKLSKTSKSKLEKSFITSIEYYGEDYSTCIKVSNKDHLFLTTGFTITHNSYDGAACDAHELLFDGLKKYIPGTISKTVVSIVVGASIGDKSSETIEKIVTMFENLPGGWKENTIEARPSPFAKIMVGSTKPNNGDSPWRNEIPVNVGGIDKVMGSGCKLKHVIFTSNNPQAAAGGRNTIIHVEEVGLCHNLLDVHGSNEANQFIDHYIGSSLYTGTGGNVDKIMESEKIFRNPKDYRMLAFDDIWENMGSIGWFVPATHTNNKFKDENGNTDEEEAMAFYEKRREDKRKSVDSKALEYEMMNYPLIPSEMFLSTKSNRFPLNILRLRKSELISTELSKGLGMTGFFEEEEGESVWNPTLDVVPIREFPLSRTSNSTGCIEMWELPKKDNDDEIIRGRYIAALDPVDDDEENTIGTKRSLQSFWILDLWTDRLVLEYTGRTEFAEDFYSQCLLATLFYKATILYENQKKGFFTFMDKMNYLSLLEDNPKQLQSTEDLGIGKIKNTKKGAYLTGHLKNWGLEMLNEYLRKTAYGEESKTNATKLKSLGLVLELLSYGPKVNVDRISSLIILMIYRNLKEKEVLESKTRKVKAYVKDPFIERNYGKFEIFDKKNIWTI